jgi:hypothetical protein
VTEAGRGRGERKNFEKKNKFQKKFVEFWQSIGLSYQQVPVAVQQS